MVIFLKIVKDILFDGKGCAISIASASMMTEATKGLTLKEIIDLADGISNICKDQTLLNNVISSFATGIQLDIASEHVVVGGTVYHNNAQDLQVLTGGNQIGLGAFPIVLDSTDILFVGADNDNFYPASGSEVIDSSIQSFQDRSVMTTVKEAVGIGISPILAPEMDALGQMRVDDPSVMTPSGLGGNVFVDRGAIDRSDFTGPRAMIVDPVIYSGQSADIPSQNIFELKTQGLSELNIKLVDGTNLLDTTTGSGIDDDSIDTQTVKLFRNGEEMELGKDYQAYYDATNDIIKLRPVSGLFETDSEYLITLSNIGGYVLEMEDGGQYPEGDVVTVVDAQGEGVSFEYDSGYTVFVRPSFTLVFPVDGGKFIKDGEKVLTKFFFLSSVPSPSHSSLLKCILKSLQTVCRISNND